MDLSQLKTQLMTMFMMRGHGTNSSDITTILYSMLVMNFFEYLFRNFPSIVEYTTNFVKKQTNKNAHPFLSLKSTSTPQTTITLQRIFTESDDKRTNEKVDNVYVEKVDAVLDYICSLDSAKHIRFDTRISLNTTDDIDLTPLLKAKVKSVSNGEDGSITEVLIYSSTLKVSDIRNWIDDIHANYVSEKNNKLGNRIYFFNEIPVDPIVQHDIGGNGAPKTSYKWDTMPKMLTFTMNEFKTSKSFSNVYGDHVNELKERLDLFTNHPEWYLDRGIPHSLGILLHGIPGAGKTSTIKAIAKDTHRHIFNLSLRPFTTQRQLNNLFYNETVLIQTYDGGKQTLKIPLNKRVYVIEDIDCLTDVVIDRRLKPTQAPQEGDAVTLSFLLNLLDGVLETPGRIVVITSNFPEKLDAALVRPGRIDVKLEFKDASRQFIHDMVCKFYNKTEPLSFIPADLADTFTPAEVMESMCINFKDSRAAITHLQSRVGSKRESKEALTVGTLLQITDAVEATGLIEEEVAVVPSITPSEPPAKPSEPKKALPPMKSAPITNTFITDFSCADFTDAEFLPGGMMPGESPNAVRSTVDLNMIRL